MDFLNQYLITNKIDKVESVRDYPLIKRIYISGECKYVLKYLPYEFDRLIWLEEVYKSLSNYDSQISKPIINIQGRYISERNNLKFVLFDCYENTKSTFYSAEWWSKIMVNIHDMDINAKHPRLLDLSNCTGLLEKAFFYMDFQTRKTLDKYFSNDILNSIDFSEKKFNHADLLLSNVLKYHGQNVLIDFENCCIAPKEFDIQRHLCDYMVHCDNYNEIVSYFKQFLIMYEYQGSKINMHNLYYLFIIDFCRTLSWLHLVVNDNCRNDLKRQLKDLRCFISSLKKDNFQKILNLLGEYL